ncbi:MAG: DUF2442 domain-containing protein [Fibrobacteres bacterium]|nr:DUF2442 domain-containing protein [Fibrobacterota bacterium]
MDVLLDVMSVKPRPDFTLLLKFENSETRIFDMRPLLDKKPFTNLKDTRLFLQAHVENGTVVWPGNLDIAPETLFDHSVPVTADQQANGWR